MTALNNIFENEGLVQQHILHALMVDFPESTHKGVNWRSKYVTQVQQQRPESPTVTQLTCV